MAVFARQIRATVFRDVLEIVRGFFNRENILVVLGIWQRSFAKRFDNIQIIQYILFKNN